MSVTKKSPREALQIDSSIICDISILKPKDRQSSVQGLLS